MAFAAQTVTPALVSFGHIRVRKNSNATTTSNGAKRTLERVTGIANINLGETHIDHIGYNADGTAQLAYIFKQAWPMIEITVTLDEMLDLDTVSGAANWQGYLTDVDFGQVYPRNATKGWRLVIPTAYCHFSGLTPNMDTPTNITWTCKAYRTPGSPLYTFDADYTV